jgi:hypothetical protein
MSDALNALRNELTTWYASLDQRTQGFFEQEEEQTSRRVLQTAPGEPDPYANLAAEIHGDEGESYTTALPPGASDA